MEKFRADHLSAVRVVFFRLTRRRSFCFDPEPKPREKQRLGSSGGWTTTNLIAGSELSGKSWTNEGGCISPEKRVTRPALCMLQRLCLGTYKHSDYTHAMEVYDVLDSVRD